LSSSFQARRIFSDFPSRESGTDQAATAKRLRGLTDGGADGTLKKATERPECQDIPEFPSPHVFIHHPHRWRSKLAVDND